MICVQFIYSNYDNKWQVLNIYLINILNIIVEISYLKKQIIPVILIADIKQFLCIIKANTNHSIGTLAFLGIVLTGGLGGLAQNQWLVVA